MRELLSASVADATAVRKDVDDLKARLEAEASALAQDRQRLEQERSQCPHPLTVAQLKAMTYERDKVAKQLKLANARVDRVLRRRASEIRAAARVGDTQARRGAKLKDQMGTADGQKEAEKEAGSSSAAAEVGAGIGERQVRRLAEHVEEHARGVREASFHRLL